MEMEILMAGCQIIRLVNPKSPSMKNPRNKQSIGMIIMNMRNAEIKIKAFFTLPFIFKMILRLAGNIKLTSICWS